MNAFERIFVWLSEQESYPDLSAMSKLRHDFKSTGFSFGSIFCGFTKFFLMVFRKFSAFLR